MNLIKYVLIQRGCTKSGTIPLQRKRDVPKTKWKRARRYEKVQLVGEQITTIVSLMQFFTLSALQRNYISLSSGEDVISECLTCSMIKMGSSVSYSDDRCPQCGASTTKTFLCWWDGSLQFTFKSQYCPLISFNP